MKYRVGDEVTLRGKVTDLGDFPQQVLQVDLDGKHRFWIPAELVEFERHTLRHLRPGDRAVSDNGTELLWLGEAWWNVNEQLIMTRDVYTFDTEPERWQHIPRAEALADD